MSLGFIVCFIQNYSRIRNCPNSTLPFFYKSSDILSPKICSKSITSNDYFLSKIEVVLWDKVVKYSNGCIVSSKVQRCILIFDGIFSVTLMTSTSAISYIDPSPVFELVVIFFRHYTIDKSKHIGIIFWGTCFLFAGKIATFKCFCQSDRTATPIFGSALKVNYPFLKVTCLDIIIWFWTVKTQGIRIIDIILVVVIGRN